MVSLPVVCPVCGGHEELEARTPEEVLELMSCALPRCPRCGWAREEDHSSPAWERLGQVYSAHLAGRDLSRADFEELTREL